jgi:ribose 5-phosphate isomerase A
MSRTLTPVDAAKRAAGLRALDFVEPGMRLGIGTGSTADWFTRALGERVRAGGLRGLVGVPTSVRTGELAEREGIALTTLDEVGWLDLTVDGADEIDPALGLIKGGGGALLQEKIVACASDRMVVIADAGKRVARLGAFPLPVEIVPFGWETTKAIVERTLEGARVGGRTGVLRLDRDAPFVTDGGHFILDLHLRAIEDAPALAAALTAIPGVVETGLFLGVAALAVIGHEDGRSEIVERPERGA